MTEESLRVQISEEGADPERVDALTGYLRAELLRLDVADVTGIATGEPPPPGARGFDVSVVGGLLVTIGQSADSLHSVMLAIMDWLQRGGETGRWVRLELDGDKLEFSQASVADQERLIELFVSRHSAGNGGQWSASGKR